MGADASKIKVKLGGHEFEFEGDPGMAKQLYEGWLKAVAGAAAPAPTPPPAADATTKKAVQNPFDAPPAPTAPPITHPQVDDPGLLRRLFVERDGVITLQALPKTSTAEEDALLLLLYGYHELKASEYPVTGVRMMQAAKLSGIRVDRIDRTISAHEQYVLSAGQRRGKRYSLNNQGVAKAKEILNATFG